MDEPSTPSTTPPPRGRDDAAHAALDPEFGPSGYLPDRAAQRARKIVLRSPLGIQWVIASLVAGLVVVVAGVWLLVASGGPPGEPWVQAIEVDALEDTAVDRDLDVLLVGAGGRVRAFADAPQIDYCPQSHRLEAADGRVWALTGRGLDGTGSLDEHPTLVQDGVVYVDPTRTRPGPAPSDEPAEPAC
ncbi:MAG: hypothetical protein ACLFRD_06680 [Nitriliruptoraceae bacterium]